MRKILLAFSAFLISSSVIQATDLVLNNGAKFSDITVTKTTPLGIKFICNGSAGWADFRDMPLDEANGFGYDSAKAASFEQMLQQNQGSSMSDDASPEDYISQDNINNSDNVPQTDDNTVVVNPGDSIPYDANIIYDGGGSPQWVVWNGHRYPYNEWHHWYWNHHWVKSNNGRYVPSHYYHHQYEKHDGRYYPYKNNLQPNKPNEPYRSPQKEGGQRFEPRSGGGIQYCTSGGGGGEGGGGRRR